VVPVSGGILNGGTLTINNSTISGNHVDYFADAFSFGNGGGGVSNGGTLTINNSTISGNSVHYMVNGISSSPGGGIYGNAILQNSIVANNTMENCDGGMTSNGYNMSSDGSCNFSSSGDRNNTDPMLGPLQYNGGPTQTMALLPGSPAIDAGNPSGCTDDQGHLLKTDQRGMPRPDTEDTGGCDMGAYESQTDATKPQPSPVDLLKDPLSNGFGNDASADVCLPLGHYCRPAGRNSACCSDLCGYRLTCCQLPLRGMYCTSNVQCCSDTCINHRCE
jgi:hypothetical protein